jgi:hypothetical protein
MAEEDCANKVLILSVILISRKSVAFPIWIFVSVLPTDSVILGLYLRVFVHHKSVLFRSIEKRKRTSRAVGMIRDTLNQDSSVTQSHDFQPHHMT